MPTDMPNNRTLPNGLRTDSEFIECANFLFRLRDVDGFFHQAGLEEGPVTIVNFKGFTEAIPDPERRLFDFLVAKFQPEPVGHIDAPRIRGMRR
jgi:hypothetical protein